MAKTIGIVSSHLVVSDQYGNEEFSYLKSEVTYRTTKHGINLFYRDQYKRGYSPHELVDNYFNNEQDFIDIITMLRLNTGA